MRSATHRITISSVCLFLLVVSSLFALTLSAELAKSPPASAGSTRAISTVRAYYASVRDFLETGDMKSIRDVLDPSLLDGENANSGAGKLALHLRGLRETYPALTFSVEELTANDQTVIARIAFEYGPSSSAPVSPLSWVPARQQIETLRIEEDRIVDWQSTSPAFGLFAPNSGSGCSLVVRGARTLTTARLSFEGGKSQFVRVPAPALLIPERGSVTIQGNGLAIVSTIDHPEGQVAEPGSEVIVHPGESVVLPDGWVVLSPGSSRPATVRAVLFIGDQDASPSRENHAAYPALEERMANEMSGPIGPGISIEYLDRAAGSTSGALQLDAGIAMLKPGDVMILDRSLESVVTLPQTGTVSMAWDIVAQRRMLINEGSVEATIWIAGVRRVAIE